jgi:tetratricopeptide (TPR) repeat protein
VLDGAAALAPSADPNAGESVPSATVVTEAKQRFDRGLDLYSEGEYPLALIEFTRAYELVPNYRVLYNIAQVGIQLGQYANARRALEQYAAEGSETMSADRRAGVARDLEMLERRTAFIEINVNVAGAEVLVDDVVEGKSPLGPALLVDAGVHRISVRHTGYQQRMSRVTLAGGDRQALALTLERQPETNSTIVVERAAPEDNTKTLMIAGWVTTGALAAGAIVTGIMGAGEAEELEQLKASNPSDYEDLGARLDKTKSNAGALFLASDVFSAGAVVVGGLSLWITVAPPGGSTPSSSEKPVPPPSARPLQVGFQENQLKFRGSF